MSEKKESAVFILSDKARFLDWAKRMINANPSILNIKFGDRSMDILIFLLSTTPDIHKMYSKYAI